MLIESLNWLVRQESELELRHVFLGKFSSVNYAQRHNYIANEFKLETEWIILQMFRCCNIKVTPQLPRGGTSNITKSCPCNEHTLTLHFYIVKLGFTGVYNIFLFLLQNIDCRYSLEPPH